MKGDLKQALMKIGGTPTTEDNNITLQTEDTDLKKAIHTHPNSMCISD